MAILNPGGVLPVGILPVPNPSVAFAVGGIPPVVPAPPGGPFVVGIGGAGVIGGPSIHQALGVPMPGGGAAFPLSSFGLGGQGGAAMSLFGLGQGPDHYFPQVPGPGAGLGIGPSPLLQRYMQGAALGAALGMPGVGGPKVLGSPVGASEAAFGPAMVQYVGGGVAPDTSGELVRASSSVVGGTRPIGTARGSTTGQITPSGQASVAQTSANQAVSMVGTLGANMPMNIWAMVPPHEIPLTCHADDIEFRNSEMTILGHDFPDQSLTIRGVTFHLSNTGSIGGSQLGPLEERLEGSETFDDGPASILVFACQAVLYYSGMGVLCHFTREILEHKLILNGRDNSNKKVLRDIRQDGSSPDKPSKSLVKYGHGWMSILDRPGSLVARNDRTLARYDKYRISLYGSDGSRVILVAILAIAWRKTDEGLWVLDGEPLFQVVSKERS